MKHLSLCASVLSVVAFSSIANAAIMIQGNLTPTGSPADGLDSYTITAVGTDGEVINSIAGIQIGVGGSGVVHNVQPAFAPETVTQAQWNPVSGAGDASWAQYDTYLLFNPSNGTNVVGFIGSATESNDGMDIANLALSAGGQNATVGVGEYQFVNATDQITLTPAAASSDLPFMQVVIPRTVGGSLNAPTMTVTLFDNQGNASPQSFVIGIPEPASMLLAMGGLATLLVMQRRVKH